MGHLASTNRISPAGSSLLLAAWSWSAAETNDLGKKRRYVEAILRLDPDSEWAHTVWLWVLQEQRRQRTMTDWRLG